MVFHSSLTGSAGEHYVMSQLLIAGFVAALAPVGVPTTDIIVTNDIGDRLCSIQVKTRREIGSDGGWHMSKKHETIVQDALFYAFVGFKADPAVVPDLFVVPSSVVGPCLATCHAAWLCQLGRNDRVRNDNDMRRFLPDNSKLGIDTYGSGWLEPYRNAWSALRFESDR